MNARAISIQAFVCAACIFLLSTVHAKSSRLMHHGVRLTVKLEHAVSGHVAHAAHVSYIWALLMTSMVAAFGLASRSLDRGRDTPGKEHLPGTAPPSTSYLNSDLAFWVVVFGWLFIFTHRVPIVGGIDVPLVDVATVRTIFVLAAAGTATIYLSSLVDRYYVRPRMSGGHWRGAMPCHAFGSEPNWRRVTQIWLLHRMLSYLAVVAAGAGIVILPLAHWLGGLTQADVALIAAAATIIAGYYLSRAAPIIAFVENPPVSVGDVIDVAEEFDTKLGLSSYYIVDISVEGLKLRRLPARGAIRTHDRLLDINDVSRLLRARDVEHKPCVYSCQLVNVHCSAVTRDRDAPDFRKRLLWPLSIIRGVTNSNQGETPSSPATGAGRS